MPFSRLLTPVFATACALAQSSQYQRIENPWPSSISGTDTAIACGDFVPDSFGRSAAVVRNGTIFLSFQPAMFEHFHAEGPTGVVAIATVNRAQPRPDLLAAITTQGLKVMKLTAGGFAIAGSTGQPLASWAGGSGVRTFVAMASGVPTEYVLGWASGWVRTAALDTSDNSVALTEWVPPGGATVLDAALLDWVPGGAPEIVVLTTADSYVLDAAGSTLVTLPSATTAGKLVPYRAYGTSAVTFLRQSAQPSMWAVETWRPSGPGGSVQVFPGGSLQLPSAPLGLGATNLDTDSDIDVIVSTGDCYRRILRGAPNVGPQANQLITVPDVSVIPQQPIANTAPAVLDDIDRDGNVDLVIPQAAVNELVVLPRIRMQVNAIEFLLEAALSVPTFVGSLGYDPSPTLSASFYTPPQNHDLGHCAGVRVSLPVTWTTAWWVEVVVYRVTWTGSSDVVDPSALWRFQYAAPALSSAGTYAIDIPIPVGTALMNTNSGDNRRLFEISAVVPNGNVPTSTTPIFVQLDMLQSSIQPGWNAFRDTIPTTAETLTPIVDPTTFVDSTWGLGTTALLPPQDPGGTAPSRFIGAKFRVPKQKAIGHASSPAPVSAGAAVVH